MAILVSGTLRAAPVEHFWVAVEIALVAAHTAAAAGRVARPGANRAEVAILALAIEAAVSTAEVVALPAVAGVGVGVDAEAATAG